MITACTRLRLRNCTGDRLTATLTSAGHFVASAQASRSTHSPSGDDQSDILGDRDELGRRDHALFGMPPAQQRFETADPVGGNIHQWLIVQFEFAVGEGAPQIELHVAALSAPAGPFPVRRNDERHRRPTSPDTAPCRRCASIPRGVVAVAGRQRDADAGADDDLDAVDVVARAQASSISRVGEITRLVRRGVGGQHDRELVAAEAGHEIVAAAPPPAAARPPASAGGRPSDGRSESLTFLNRSRSTHSTADAPAGRLAALQRLRAADPGKNPGSADWSGRHDGPYGRSVPRPCGAR